MGTIQDGKVAIDRVGAPGKAWLELRGSILLYHKQTWVSSSSMYIPVEWVRVSHGHRRDLRRLWHGLLGLMVAVLFALPLALTVRMHLREPLDIGLAAGLAVGLVFTLGVGLWSLLTFLQSRSITTISVEGTPYAFILQFWPPAHGSAALEALLERVAAAQHQFRETGLHPVRMNHLWSHPRPFRIALIKGLAVSFAMYIVFLALEVLRLSGHGWPVPRWCYALLAVPPLANLGAVAFWHVLGLSEACDLRRAARCYRRGALSEAVQLLERRLEADSGHTTARLLIIRVLTELGAFEDALRHCTRLAEEHPIAATRLESTIWDLKRMHARMDDNERR